MKMGKFEIIDIFSKKKSKNPTPLTVDPIYFYIIFFVGIVFSGSLYPGGEIIKNLEFASSLSLTKVFSVPWTFGRENKNRADTNILCKKVAGVINPGNRNLSE